MEEEILQVLRNLDSYLTFLQQEKTFDLEAWLPSIVSVVTLVINLIFLMLIKPKAEEKIKNQQEFLKDANAMLDYLSKVVSLTSYAGAPTTVRQLSIKLLMHYTEEPLEISEMLESIFQLVKKRKELTEKEDINSWEKEILKAAKRLRGYVESNKSQVK